MDASMITISTWAEVCDHLAAKSSLTRGADDVASVTVPISPEPWVVTLRLVDVYGMPWIEVASTIGEARFASPQAMLADSAELAIGGLCIARDGSVVLRQRLPLAHLRVLELDEVVQAIAKQAAKAALGLRKHAPHT